MSRLTLNDNDDNASVDVSVLTIQFDVDYFSQSQERREKRREERRKERRRSRSRNPESRTKDVKDIPADDLEALIKGLLLLGLFNFL